MTAASKTIPPASVNHVIHLVEDVFVKQTRAHLAQKNDRKNRIEDFQGFGSVHDIHLL